MNGYLAFGYIADHVADLVSAMILGRKCQPFSGKVLYTSGTIYFLRLVQRCPKNVIFRIKFVLKM